MLLLLFLATALPVAGDEVARVEAVYPDFCAGAIRACCPADLQPGVLAASDGFSITQKDLEAETTRKPESVRAQYKQYPVTVLQEMVTRKLVAEEARQWSASGTTAKPQRLIKDYLEARVPRYKATDQDVRDYYAEHEKLFGGATFDQVRDVVRTVVSDERTEIAEREFVSASTRRHLVRVSRQWLDAQQAGWRSNPVESARRSGKPTVAVFSVIGCCDRMFPVCQELRARLSDRAGVVFVHVGEREVLASLYGVETIPVVVLFDREGRQLLRYLGPMTAEQVETRLREAGG
jgi:thioredoxin 1